MTLDRLLMTSAAAVFTASLSAVSGANAADAIVAASPEPMEYLRICDAYGKGYFYIPGTETCLKIGGYIRFDSTFVESPYSGDHVGWDAFSRGAVTLDARSDTEYGLLRSFVELRADTTAAIGDAYINSAYLELGGFRAGYSDSRFDTWLNSAGNIINDDVIDYTGPNTNQISYVYGGEAGLALLVGAEEGDGQYDTGDPIEPVATYQSDGAPHLIAGARYVEDWGGLYIIGGYDTGADAFGGKVRADLKLNDRLSLFVMAGYQSDWENNDGVGGTRRRNVYGPWNGDWAVWSGLAAELADKTTLNVQGAYEEDGTFAAALNVDYAIVEGLKIQPELNYTNFGGTRGNGEAYGGTIRVQRDF